MGMNPKSKSVSLKEPLASYLIGTEGKFAPVNPVLKWAGGKGQLIPQMAPYFPGEFNFYHEPFLGGAAVFFHLVPKHGAKSFLSDAVPDLINFYIVLKEKTSEFIEGIKELNRRYQNANSKQKKEIFYKYRKFDRNGDFEQLNDLTKAIRFFFLNKTAFNGLYRTNSSGLFNVPWGKYEKPSLYMPNELSNAAEVLRLFTQQIKIADFEIVLDNAKAGDFVYLDPPYVPLSVTSSFTSYAANGFTLKDQTRLVSVCVELDKRNIMFMLSNSDVPFVRKSYDLFNIHVLSARRNINANGEGRGRINELLITNY